MKNFVKAFFNNLYLSILLFFTSRLFCTVEFIDLGHFLGIPPGKLGNYLERFCMIISTLPFIIWGIKSLYYFFQKKQENILPSSKTLIVFKLLFLLLAAFAASLSMPIILYIFLLIPLLLCSVFTMYLLKRTYGARWGWTGLSIILFLSYLCLNSSVRCPPDKPLEDVIGRCHSCDEKEPIHGAYKCSKRCPNRTYMFRKHLCTIVKSCSSDKPLLDMYGNCYSCDYPGVLSVADCSVCPNRTTAFGWLGNCSLSTCPTDKPKRDQNGDCY